MGNAHAVDASPTKFFRRDRAVKFLEGAVTNRQIADREWRLRNDFPAFRIGGRVFYSPDSIMEWLATRRERRA